MLLVAFFIWGDGFAGDYTATNYQRSNGFPGNKVYWLHQDKYGYIWAGTENGLVSFNGYAFRLYTHKDGLPANEVIGIKEDDSGKLWLITFSNNLCYLWKGKIYNSNNDPLLRKLRFHSVLRDIRFDASGNMWISDYTGLTRINKRQEVTRIDTINGVPFSTWKYIFTRDRGKLMLLDRAKVYQYTGDSFQVMPQLEVPKEIASDYIARLVGIRLSELEFMPLTEFVQLQASDNKRYFKKEELPYVTYFGIPSPALIVATVNNCTYLINSQTGERRDCLLKGHTVSNCLIARDGSIWLATIGKGLFHFVPSFVRSVPCISGSPAILFIKAAAQELYVIKAPHTLVRLQPGATGQYKMAGEHTVNTKYDFSYCHYITRLDDGHWIACGGYVSRLTPSATTLLQQFFMVQCKSVIEEDKEHLLIGTVWGIYRLSKSKFVLTDTFYNKRVTCLSKIKNTVYAGTLDGLLSFDAKEKTNPALLKYPRLQYPITAMASGVDSLLWVATSQGLLIALFNNRIIDSISENDGLMCNSIAALKASDRFLWIGTDNGLYAFTRKAPFTIVRHLSTADGLSSNQITYLEAANGLVWVGTDNGLNYFPEKEITPPQAPSRFIITGIQNGKKAIDPVTSIIELTQGTLRIEFDVVDHSGMAKPVFSYRLNNGYWTNLSSPALYFPTLPYGDFSVSVEARSPHWRTPQVIRLSFHRPYPYYLNTWFIVTAGLLVVLAISGLVVLVIRRLRKKDQAKLTMQLNLLELEQMALQGQMNPHFIFNSITSIKEHYNSGDIPRANKLLDTFTALIRATFEMSAQTFTTLDKELQYLNQYLSIEQERFNYSFDFSINKEIQVAERAIPVPSMLLQPLVENAIRHGVRHLPDGTGKIGINIIQQEDMIRISITDNGLGLTYTQKLKSKLYVHSQTTSTKVNQQRIRILSKLFDQKISIHAEELTDAGNRVTGTLVSITYPLNIKSFEQ